MDRRPALAIAAAMLAACNAITGASSLRPEPGEGDAEGSDAAAPVAEADATPDPDPEGDAGRDAPGPAIDAGAPIVFVTTASFTGDLGGTSGADQKCNAAAAGAGLGGVFVAWLFTSGASAPSRLQGDGPWHLVTGTRVTVSKQALASTGPEVPIDRDENGDLVGGAVWTGIPFGGGMGLGDCNGWTDALFSSAGYAGSTLDTTEWTSTTPTSCSAKNHLYCFRQ